MATKLQEVTEREIGGTRSRGSGASAGEMEVGERVRSSLPDWAWCCEDVSVEEMKRMLDRAGVWYAESPTPGSLFATYQQGSFTLKSELRRIETPEPLIPDSAMLQLGLRPLEPKPRWIVRVRELPYFVVEKGENWIMLSGNPRDAGAARER